MALKTSILIFYLRLSKNTQPILRMCSWVVLAIVNVAGFILTGMNIKQCKPFEAAFSAYPGTPQCFPMLTEYICSAPVNVVTDLAILVLPIPVLTGMRLPKRQKCILVCTFSLGIFVTVVDVVRIYYLQQAIASAPTHSSSDPEASFGAHDFHWNASLAYMWSAVEVNTGLICACIPTLKPLLLKVLPKAIINPNVTHKNILSYGSRSNKQTSFPGKKKTTEPSVASTSGMMSPVAPMVSSALPQSDLSHFSEDEVDFIDFITDAESTQGRGAAVDRSRSQATQTTNTSHRTRLQSDAVYFGFVNMKRPKSMMETSFKDSVTYCAIVTVLFLLWGFSYGLLNTLNNVIASIAHMSQVETISLTSAYFGGGYFFGPLLVGEWVLRGDEHARFSRWRHHKDRELVGGFKATFIIGLIIYGIGTIMFWPCAVLRSFPGFVISNFVVGFGLGVLETAANPFIILCGPPAYAEVRILIAQGVQGIASICSGLVGRHFLFVDLGSSERKQREEQQHELLEVQWTYLAITLFCVVLALFLYYMPLPEVLDAELGPATEHLPVDPRKKHIGVAGFQPQLRTVMLVLAVAAQWTYVAAQESMSVFFGQLITAFLPDANPGAYMPLDKQSAGLALSVMDYILVAHAAFTFSRLGAAGVIHIGIKHPHIHFLPSPRILLLLLVALAVLCVLVCISLREYHSPNAIVAPAVLFFFAEGPLWPLIFALGLRGQGDRTKSAAAWLTMGASGPAFWPFVMYGIVEGGESRSAQRLQVAFVVVLVLMLGTLAYPVFLTVVRDARMIVDPLVGKAWGAGGEDLEQGRGDSGVVLEGTVMVKQGGGRIGFEG